MTVNTTEKGKFYDSVKIEEQEGITVSQGNEVVFDAENKTIDIKVTLYKNDIACSEQIAIEINIDAESPVATFKQGEK